MSETPERKVLKEMIQKLKAKLIQSVNTYSTHQGSVSNTIQQVIESIGEQMKELPNEDKPLALLLFAVIGSVNEGVSLMISNVNAVLSDMDLYIETLERYSTELDNTLEDIFGKARKMAEEEQKKQEELRKKQEELRKRKPSYRA